METERERERDSTGTRDGRRRLRKGSAASGALSHLGGGRQESGRHRPGSDEVSQEPKRDRHQVIGEIGKARQTDRKRRRVRGPGGMSRAHAAPT